MIGHDLVNAFIVFYLRSLGKIILFSIDKLSSSKIRDSY